MKIIDLLTKPSLEQEILLSHILGKDRSFLAAFPETELTKEQLAEFQGLTQRQENHEPLAYLLGHKEFYGRKFFVNDNVLIPRPETEDLVKAVLQHCNNRYLTVVDVGTGSGAIAITLKLEQPQLNVIAIDIDRKALEISKRNAKLFRVFDQITFLQSDMLDKLATSVDVIVANLPYIPTKNWQQLPPEIRDFEPRVALDSGETAEVLYQRLFNQAKSKLKPNGKIFYELDGKVLTK